MSRLNIVNRQLFAKFFFAIISSTALCFVLTTPTTAQVPSVTFTQANGLCGVGMSGCGDYSATGQHLGANSRGDLFIPGATAPIAGDPNATPPIAPVPGNQFIEEIPANGGSPVILFTGLNPSYGGRAVYVDSANNLYYTYADSINYSVDVIYVPFRNGAYPAAVSYTSINNNAGKCSAFPVPVTQTTTCRVPLNYPSQYNYYVQAADLGMDGSGNLYMLAKYESTCGTSTCYNAIIEFGTNGTTTILDQILPNNTGQPEIAVSKTGEIYYTDGQGNNTYFAAGSTTAVSLNNTFYYIAGVSIDQGGNVYFTQKNGATGSSIIVLPYINGTACQGATCGNDQYVLSYNLSDSNTSDPNLGVAVSGYGKLFFLGDYPNSVSSLLVGGLSFGSTTVGASSGTQTLLLTFGSNNRTFDHFTATGPFSVTATTCVQGTTYGAYAGVMPNYTRSCTVTLKYSASAPGPQTGSVEAIDSSGNLIGEAELSGIGSGATINVDPGAVSAIGGTWTAPDAVAVDSSLNTYVADSTTGNIYKTALGSSTSTTIATGFSNPTAIAVDGSGNVYVGNEGQGAVVEIANTAGTYSTTKQVLVTGLSGASGLVADSLGNVYVADSGNGRVLLLARSGNQADGTIVSTVGSGFTTPVALAVDSSQNLYVSDAGAKKVYQFAIPTGTLTTVASGLSAASGVAVDAGGGLFIVDSGAKTITHIPNSSGSLNAAKQVQLGTVVTSPNAIAVDSTGNVYVTGSNTSTATPPVTAGAVAVMNRTSGLLQFGNEEELFSTPSSAATLSNGGTLSLTFNSPYYSASNNTGYALQGSTTCANGTVLAVGAACSIAAVFTPPSTGAYIDTLSFSSTPASTSTLVLSGTGVNLPHTTTTISSVTPASPTYGQTVTVVANVAPATTGTQPLGTVTFYVDNVAQTPTYAVNATTGNATITLSSLTATTHTIVASYSGSTTYAPSSSVTTNLSVGVTATTTAVSFAAGTVYTNPTSQAPGANVTILGTVSPAAVGSLSPSGTVTFYTAGVSTPLGSAPVVASGNSYVASFSSTAIQIGTYNIYGVYSGDTNYAKSTSTPNVPLIISNPTILMVPASNSIVGGGAADVLTIYSVGGFGDPKGTTNGQVIISCGTLPLYAACSINAPFVQVNPTVPGSVSLSVVINQPPVIAVPGGLDALPKLHGHPWMQALLVGLFLIPAALVGFGLRRRKTSRMFVVGRMAMIALLLLCSTTAFTGCGGSLNGTYLTPKGTTTLAVSGTITTGAVKPPPAQTVSLSLIVQ